MRLPIFAVNRVVLSGMTTTGFQQSARAPRFFIIHYVMIMRKGVL